MAVIATSTIVAGQRGTGMDKLAAIEALLRATSATTGDRYFEALIHEIGPLFKADDVFFAFALDRPATKVRVHCIWSSSGNTETFDYDLDGTPCQLVYKGEPTLIPCDVCRDFPAEADTEDESFIGIPLLNPHPGSTSEVIGHLAIYSTRPIEDKSDLVEVANLFAGRAQAEVVRTRVEEERKRLIDELRKAKQHADYLNDLKSRFIGIAAHDLRSSIQIAKGNVSMLKNIGDKIDDAKREDMLEATLRATDTMETLVHDYLEFAMLEQEDMPLQLEQTNIGELTNARVELARLFADRKNITIEVTFSSELPGIEIDPDKIGQALDNLLSNAVKYSPLESVVNVTVTPVDGRQQLEISIADQGPGVPEAQIEDLFKPFTTTENQPTGGEKSVGLGLSIVKKIITAHGGSVNVKNGTDAGAEFIIRLNTTG